MWSRHKRTNPSGNLTTVQHGDFMSVPAIDFSGFFSKSNNGRYAVAWSDFDPASGRGGYREQGFGAYLLAEDNRVVTTGKVERPNDGKVADNGTFILNDWMFGEGLKGVFLAFDSLGQVIVRHQFAANLLNNGISDDGRWAVCQLCHSDTDDGGVLAFFDLQTGTLLWKRVPETGWAHDYSFDVESRLLTLRYPEGDQFRYDFEGLLLDRAKWRDVFLKRATGFELHRDSKQKLAIARDTGDMSNLQEVLQVLETALGRGLDDYPAERAAILRTMGEIRETRGETTGALALYEEALSVDPKVGLKRKIAAMKASGQ